MAKRAPKTDTSDFPAYNVPPTKHILEACEALCWIGYKRPIPRKLYFRAMPDPWRGNAEAEASLYAAIPNPKPRDNPMDDAQRQLMHALRQDKLRALTYRTEMDPPRVLDRSDFDLAVIVTPRGDLCADQMASAEDRDQAGKVAKSGLRFLTEEVIWNWPAKGSRPVDEHTSGAPAPAILTLFDDRVRQAMGDFAGMPKTARAGGRPGQPTKRKPGGHNYAEKDRPLIEEMKGLIDQGKASSVWDAARAVVSKAAGGGQSESKVKRLAKRYAEVYP